MASTSRDTTTDHLAGVVRLATALAGILGSVLLGSLLASAPAAAATHTIVIRQYAYSPASLTIRQGNTVTWTNQDSVEHDVTVTQGPTSFRSPMLAKGQSWRHTFDTPGTWSYICSVHPDMRATVTVQPRPTPTPSAAAASLPPTGAARPEATHTAGPKHPAGNRPAAPASSAAPNVAAAGTTAASAVSVPTQAASLDPLLLVAGLSASVTVFCLLLMTSRPVVREDVVTVDD